MFSYDYVRNRIEPTSFVEFFGNSIRYWFRIWGFYFRRWLSTTLKQEPQPYYIYHYVHTNEEYGRIGEEFVLYDIPNRRNLVYVLGKLNIEKHWDSWVRNPLYDNQNKQHLFRIYDVDRDELTELTDPLYGLEEPEEHPDYQYWDSLFSMALEVITTEHDIDEDELTNWYNKQQYINGEGW